MIIGKDSIWKMLALFLLAIFAVLNVIGTYLVTDAAYHGTPLTYWFWGILVVLNSVVIVAAAVIAIILLYKKWEDKSNPKQN